MAASTNTVELPLKAIRAIFSDIDGTLVHYAHVLEKAGYRLADGIDAATLKDGDSTLFVHEPSGSKIPVVKVPSLTLGGGYISQKTLDLVKELRENGVVFSLLTGARTSTFLLRRDTGAVPLPDFGVCEGGGKLFALDKTSGKSSLDEEWISRFADVTGDWQQFESPPLDRQGKLWDCFRELYEEGYALDAKSFSTSFLVDLRKGRHPPGAAKEKVEEEKAVKTAEMFQSLEGEEDRAKGLFIPGSATNYRERYGLEFVTNLGKGQVAPIGCNKRTAVEYILSKTGVSSSESIALFDDENDLEFAELCAGGIVPSIAHSSVIEALEKRLNSTTFVRPAVTGFLAIEAGLEAALRVVKQQQPQ